MLNNYITWISANFTVNSLNPLLQFIGIIKKTFRLSISMVLNRNMTIHCFNRNFTTFNFFKYFFFNFLFNFNVLVSIYYSKIWRSLQIIFTRLFQVSQLLLKCKTYWFHLKRINFLKLFSFPLIFYFQTN